MTFKTCPFPQALRALLAMAPVCLDQYRSDSTLLGSLLSLRDQYQAIVQSEMILGEENSYFAEIVELIDSLQVKMKWPENWYLIFQCNAKRWIHIWCLWKWHNRSSSVWSIRQRVFKITACVQRARNTPRRAYMLSCPCAWWLDGYSVTQPAEYSMVAYNVWHKWNIWSSCRWDFFLDFLCSAGTRVTHIKQWSDIFVTWSKTPKIIQKNNHTFTIEGLHTTTSL